MTETLKVIIKVGSKVSNYICYNKLIRNAIHEDVFLGILSFKIYTKTLQINKYQLPTTSATNVKLHLYYYF